MQDKLNWPAAKQRCLDNGATLACFKTTIERDFWSTKCEGCWAGYAWIEGIYDFELHLSEMFEQYNVRLFLITDKWQSQASNDAICPYDIVPGKGHYWDLTGSCAKMLSSSPNKLEGGECDDDIDDFICQKVKEVTSVQLNGKSF